MPPFLFLRVLACESDARPNGASLCRGDRPVAPISSGSLSDIKSKPEYFIFQ
jgi:hypothetical protein